MLIEALASVRIRHGGQEHALTRGEHLDLPEENARRLLCKAPDKVRLVPEKRDHACYREEDGVLQERRRMALYREKLTELVPSNQDLVVEPAAHLCTVYWLSKRRIAGPSRVVAVAKVTNMDKPSTFWLCIAHQGSWRWVHESLMRSKRDYDSQDARQCRCCSGSDFWTSVHGVTICRRCHPPAHHSLQRPGAPD
jgi:hypothetical protein